MKPAHLILFLFLCAAAGVWTALALPEQYVWLEYRGLISDIREGSTKTRKADIEEAIAGYEDALRLAPCNVSLHKDRILLLTRATDIAMTEPYVPEVDVYLEKTLNALSALLLCTPTDGKAWLDYAVLDVYREGFTERAQQAYKMSAKVSPGESWLAEKRLLFALKFLALFDPEARRIALSDVDTLTRAHSSKMMHVIKASGLQSEAELREVLTPPEE